MTREIQGMESVVVPRNICVVTGSRAEYGLFTPVMRAIISNPLFNLQLSVTGTHLSSRHGNTEHFILRDGFRIDARVDIGLENVNTGADAAKATGRGISGFADAFRSLAPDLVLILGDRYEILAAATATLLMGIPLAHIAGGDLTEGAFDDSIRHCLTKMAHLHFATCKTAARRLVQLGENPDRIIISGSPGIDVIRSTRLLPRNEAEARLGFALRHHNLLITFHPVTRGTIPGLKQFDELLSALSSLGADIGLVFTAPNADPGASEMRDHLHHFIASHPNACFHESLGQELYLSTLAQCDAVVGNSSSGIYEAPSLKKPTVDIGDRQAGREKAASVISCEPYSGPIVKAIHQAFALDCSMIASPYGDGHAADRIASHLATITDFSSLLHKRFVDVKFAQSQENLDE